MKTMMASTSVRFPRAPTELPMILMSMLRVGQDLASLKTLSYEEQGEKVLICLGFSLPQGVSKDAKLGLDLHVAVLLRQEGLNTQLLCKEHTPTFLNI